MDKAKAKKYKVAIEAYSAERSVTGMTQECGVPPSQVYLEKKEQTKQRPEIFAESNYRNRQTVENARDELYRKVG